MTSKLYGIVDAARDCRLYDMVAASRHHACLFSGQLKPPLHLAAPYLVRLDTDDELTRAWQANWGRAWGILCASPLELDALRRHLRRFLQAMLPDGRIVLFRFYDPRVMRCYLSACDKEDLADWFTSVDHFRIEDEDGGQTRYSFDGTRIETRRTDMTSLRHAIEGGA